MARAQCHFPGLASHAGALVAASLGDGRAYGQMAHERVIQDRLATLPSGVVHPSAGPLNRLRLSAGNRVQPERVLGSTGRNIAVIDGGRRPADENAVVSLNPDTGIFATGIAVLAIALKAASGDDDGGAPVRSTGRAVGDVNAMLEIALRGTADQLGRVTKCALMVDEPSTAEIQVTAAADIGDIPARASVGEETMPIGSASDIPGELDMHVVDIGVIARPVYGRLASALKHAPAHPQAIAVHATDLDVGEAVAAHEADGDVLNFQAVDVAVTGDPVQVRRRAKVVQDGEVSDAAARDGVEVDDAARHAERGNGMDYGASGGVGRSPVDAALDACQLHAVNEVDRGVGVPIPGVQRHARALGRAGDGVGDGVGVGGARIVARRLKQDQPVASSLVDRYAAVVTDDFRTHRVSKTRNRKPKQPVFPVETVKVNPGVWREALRVAGGDATRIKVVSPTKVIVRD